MKPNIWLNVHFISLNYHFIMSYRNLCPRTQYSTRYKSYTYSYTIRINTFHFIFIIYIYLLDLHFNREENLCFLFWVNKREIRVVKDLPIVRSRPKELDVRVPLSTLLISTTLRHIVTYNRKAW